MLPTGGLRALGQAQGASIREARMAGLSLGPINIYLKSYRHKSADWMRESSKT